MVITSCQGVHLSQGNSGVTRKPRACLSSQDRSKGKVPRWAHRGPVSISQGVPRAGMFDREAAKFPRALMPIFREAGSFSLTVCLLKSIVRYCTYSHTDQIVNYKIKGQTNAGFADSALASQRDDRVVTAQDPGSVSSSCSARAFMAAGDGFVRPFFDMLQRAHTAADAGHGLICESRIAARGCATASQSAIRAGRFGQYDLMCNETL